MTGSGDLQPLLEWISGNWLAIVLVSIALLILFRIARPVVHRVARRLLLRRRTELGGEIDEIEAEKRASTIEDLVVKLVRAIIVITLAFVAMTALDLLPVLAGLTVIAAAVTLAGQSIVLDYLMGFLILVEGQYHRDDLIAVNGIEGTVEEVGLRRTIIRDPSGTVHSVSNGMIRASANKTRIYASLLVDVLVDQSTDVDRAVAVIDEVGAAMAADPDWSARILEPPRFVRITAMSEIGINLRITGRVRAADRQTAPGELRLRLLRAFAAEGIQIARVDRAVARPPATPGASPA